MRDEMQEGDLALFYHSNGTPSGVVGICRICKTGLVDQTAFDHVSKYFDVKSKVDHPRWIMVEVEFVEKFHKLVSLQELKEYPLLAKMPLLKKGSRLSVMPVGDEEFSLIRKLGQ